jgi:carboxyl-terminal processing protease
MHRYLIYIVLTAMLANSAAAESNADANLPRLARIMDVIRARYFEPVDENKLFNEAVNGMFRGLDMHSSYLNSDAYRRLMQDTQGRYGGLGIEVRKDGDALRIMSIFDETPAFRAELQPNDLITAINDKKLAGLSLDQSVQLARGEPSTSLALTLVRSDEPGPRRLVLDREQIQGRSVRVGLIGDRLAYVRLAQFHHHTAEELAIALERLFESNNENITGLILDLRDNPGGTLNTGVAVASAFLPKDSLVVYTNGMSPESKLKFLARKEDYLRTGSEDVLERAPKALKTIPMAVLVNQGSASASEIVAAALQDHKRCPIIGNRTYGKGSIQAIIPLGDGTALKLTTSRYYTPTGRSIDKQGIQPDYVIDRDPQDGVDIVAHLVASGRLASDVGSDPHAPRVLCAAPLPTGPGLRDGVNLSPDSVEEITIADCQLRRAIDVLNQTSISDTR